MIHKPTNHHSNEGFTLIELILAMAFVAALLIAVAVTVIQMSAVYTHGLMLTSINKAARTISSSITSDIQNSSSIDLTKQLVDNSGNGGRLCLGGYTYVWNLKGIAQNTYASSDGTLAPPISFAKLSDPGASYCSAANRNNPIPYSSTSAQRDVELLDDGSHDMVLQKVTVTKLFADPATQETLYSIYFVISTNSGSDILPPNTLPNNPNPYYMCPPPSLASGDANRCAVQDFTIAVRAGNGG